jgi:hypothetical protein
MEANDGSFGFDFIATYTDIKPGNHFCYQFGDRIATFNFLDNNRHTELTISFDPETENSLELQRNGWQAILNKFKITQKITIQLNSPPMKKTYVLSMIILMVSFITGCEKDKFTIQDGIYRGIFTVSYSNGVQTGPVTVELKSGTYICSSNSNRIPAGGSGTFRIINNKMSFSDDKMWTADFDLNLLLNGDYETTFDGKKLSLTANRNNIGTYTYELERQ